MKRYWFTLVDTRYDDLEVSIPDGSSKRTAENRARRWMRENNVPVAVLTVNSMATDNLLELIHIEI